MASPHPWVTKDASLFSTLCGTQGAGVVLADRGGESLASARYKGRRGEVDVMDITARVGALASLPLFAGFNPDEIATVAARCTEREHPKDEVLWQAGDSGDEFVVVVSGELSVWRGGDDSEVVARVGPGECLGEIALLLDEPRSATVSCSRPSRLLVLAGLHFQELLRGDARALTYVSQLLARRVVATTRARVAARKSTSIGVVADAGTPGASLVANALAAIIASLTGGRVLVVSLGDIGKQLDTLTANGAGSTASFIEHRRDGAPDRLDVALPDAADPELLGRELTTLLGVLGDEYRAVVIDLSSHPACTLAAAASACDDAVSVSYRFDNKQEAGAPHSHILRVVNRADPRSRALPLNHCEPFILPEEASLTGLRGDALIPFLQDNAWLPVTRTLNRLARKVLRATVGIALGGGAAFGISHVGVLEVLDEAGIPVDLVAGTSMGSIVGLGYAGGMTGAAMHEVARRQSNLPTALRALDLSLSGLGLMSGRRLVKTFAHLLPIETFEDLTLPFVAVATDVQTGLGVTIGTGRLEDAFRASSSIPLLFAPAERDGRMLVDGAMVDPVPADVARDMGADIVLAVNVVPKLNGDVRTPLSRAFGALNRLNPLAHLNGKVAAPHIVDILMNSLVAIQYELGNFKALTADVLVNVDLADFTWIDFTSAIPIVERGAEAADAALPAIRQAYEQRLAGV
jgi:NTE family protein